jgi:hypothetical protein
MNTYILTRKECTHITLGLKLHHMRTVYLCLHTHTHTRIYTHIFCIHTYINTYILTCGKTYTHTSHQVSSFAGSGKKGYLDGPATKAQFDNPTGICTNPSDGAIIIADSGNNAIRMIHNGMVTTLAGGPHMIVHVSDGSRASQVLFRGVRMHACMFMEW